MNAISPGFFMMPLNREQMSSPRKETALRRTPMHRFGELDELAGATNPLSGRRSGSGSGELIEAAGFYFGSLSARIPSL
jgi:NAD(P)-dependent dehydrogenase (short-subunit alcohol dehydrogenase family)